MTKENYLTCFKNLVLIMVPLVLRAHPGWLFYIIYTRNYFQLKSLKILYKKTVPDKLSFTYNYNAHLTLINPKKNQFC